MEKLQSLFPFKKFDINKVSRFGLGTIVLGCGLVCFLLPFVTPSTATEYCGLLLLLSGCAEVMHSFRLKGETARRSGYVTGAVTVGIGLLVLAAPLLLASALVYFLAFGFALDAFHHLSDVKKRASEGHIAAVREILFGLGNLFLAGLLAFGPFTLLSLAFACGLRLIGGASVMLSSPVLESTDAGHQIADELDLPDFEELRELANEISTREEAARSIDRRWVFIYLITLFAIHVARMPVEYSIVGLAGPFVAVLGDIFVALIVSFGIITPLYYLLRKLLRVPFRMLFHLGFEPNASPSVWRSTLRKILAFRLRFAIRMRQSSYSLIIAVERGLALGLPVAAVLAGTVPIWGMNWYFDSENWASGIWDSYASHRTYSWREEMVRAAVQNDGRAYHGDGFMMRPDIAGEDFSFIVIGDTGEGDASQLVLKDQLILCGLKPEVKFLVISSDVVYPDGAMRDYEHKFFLPFKGFTKPIYAIPGNHDWYDALESFSAVFFEPEAARRAIRARVEADQKLTTTTESKIDSLLRQAQTLSLEYDINVGHQKAPYFQVQTETFALIAIDTGVLRRIDPDQRRWLLAALRQAEGKFVMLLLGHPFFAEGIDWTPEDEAFIEIRNIAREAGVKAVMAGDTHDFEYYFEPEGEGNPAMTHFVNGGGGAFLSYGPSLAPPKVPALERSAIYPTRKDVIDKLEVATPWYKAPLWWWTRDFNAWPFSAKWLSAAFDYNRAPFHQSFVEVQVKPSEGVVRFIPWGVHGPLRWSDLQLSVGFELEESKSAVAAFEIPMQASTAK